MELGKSFSVQKILSVVRLRQMQDGLIYINTNNAIDCDSTEWVVLRMTQGGNST